MTEAGVPRPLGDEDRALSPVQQQMFIASIDQLVEIMAEAVKSLTKNGVDRDYAERLVGHRMLEAGAALLMLGHGVPECFTELCAQGIFGVMNDVVGWSRQPTSVKKTN